MRVRHIALMVPDLKAAEAYYRELFAMSLIGREAPGEGGQWYTLPPDKDWDDVEAAGVELGMVGLRHDDFVLALFQGDVPRGQVPFIGLYVSPEELAAVRDRLPAGTAVLADRAGYLEFFDIYQIVWQVSESGEFQTAGNSAGRWLEV
ncbi:MAG: VOC family protein [Candidatus Promineifilaceae bacterium]|nr:VOC family protein [Candidatus Promineifilaceae bacterium]